MPNLKGHLWSALKQQTTHKAMAFWQGDRCWESEMHSPDFLLITYIPSLTGAHAVVWG